MKPLFTTEHFNNAKYGTKFLCECYNCGVAFNISKGVITNILNKEYKTPKSQPKGKYCSRECTRLSKVQKITVKCNECNKSVNKHPSAIKRTKHNFCSPSCSTKFKNKNKSSGSSRSKLELWLELKLLEEFKDIEFDFNNKDAIASELDIYIPKLKLAFELNGIFHYEPRFGSDKFQKIQNNDKKKFFSCLEKGIDLCVIDTSKQTYFKENTSKVYLDIITKIVHERII